MNSLQINGTKVYCFDPKYKKLMKMGAKIGDTFFKTVEEKHFMRMVGGYGFQYDAFAGFENSGITKIEILERHTGETWMSKPRDWFEHGKIADYGRGKQIFLSLKYMARKNKEAIQKAHDQAEEVRTKSISQASLYD
jgi:hypothetical protein